MYDGLNAIIPRRLRPLNQPLTLNPRPGALTEYTYISVPPEASSPNV